MIKVGICELCGHASKRLERHHIRYNPEITINLCHDCHYKCHFWKYKLTEQELYILLSRVYKPETMIKYQGKLKQLLSLSLSHAHEKTQNQNLDMEVAPLRSILS